MKDFNLLLDKLHTTTDLQEEDLLEQAQVLKLKNETERKKVDDIFTEKIE